MELQWSAPRLWGTQPPGLLGSSLLCRWHELPHLSGFMWKSQGEGLGSCPNPFLRQDSDSELAVDSAPRAGSAAAPWREAL